MNKLKESINYRRRMARSYWHFLDWLDSVIGTYSFWCQESDWGIVNNLKKRVVLWALERFRQYAHNLKRNYIPYDTEERWLQRGYWY